METMKAEEIQKTIGCDDYVPGNKPGRAFPICTYFGTVTRRNNPQQVQRTLKGYCTKHEFMCKIYFATEILKIIKKIKARPPV